MANNDASQYTLRYNEISGAIEYGSGTNWTSTGITTSGTGVSGVSADGGSAITGTVNLVAGDNIVLTPAGHNITIDSTGGITNPPSYNTTTNGLSTLSDTYVATNLLGNFALSDSAHRVQIVVSGSIEQDTVGVSSILSVFRDGVDLSDGSGFSLSQGLSNVSILIVDSPGDTSTHTYKVYAKNSDNTGSLIFPDGAQASLMLTEIF